MSIDYSKLGPKSDTRPIEQGLPVTVHVPLSTEPDPAAQVSGQSRMDYLHTLPRRRVAVVPGDTLYLPAEGLLVVVINLRPEDGAEVVVLRSRPGSYSRGASICVSDLELNSATEVVFG